MKILNKMQRRAATWILGAFKTSPLEGIEALVGLMPIRFHLLKLSKRSLICPSKLPTNHILKNLLIDDLPSVNSSNSHNIGSLTKHQKSFFKGHLNDAHSKLLGIFPSFSPIDPKFFPGNRIVDTFSDRYSFNLANKKPDNSNNLCGQELDEMVLRLSSDSQAALIVTDASIKNDIATSISHIHSHNQPLVKTVHHASFVTTTEAELFAIRCGINQASAIPNVSKIVVVTNSMHTARRIFSNESHPYQIHTTAILSKLRNFFSTNESNSIEFWECPSKLRWRLHSFVDKDSKSFSILPSYPTKVSWDYCKKIDCDDSLNLWKMTFQASDRKCRNFLELLDDNSNPIEPHYKKGGPWLQAFGRSNSLCACAVRAITNHAPIGEYRLRFFPGLDFLCPCADYPIETRRHILHECKRFTGYWNSRRDTLNHFVMFLMANPFAFSFISN